MKIMSLDVKFTNEYLETEYTLMGFMGDKGLLWFHGLIELISNLFNKTGKKDLFLSIMLLIIQVS